MSTSKKVIIIIKNTKYSVLNKACTENNIFHQRLTQSQKNKNKTNKTEHNIHEL